MTLAADNFRALLEAGDVEGLRSAWATLRPGMPQPETREQAEIVMHHARTQAETVSFAARAWSHRWLTERNLPSGLPDRMRPNAEQVCPIEVHAVGIAFRDGNPLLRKAYREIQASMEQAVLECYADGRRDPALVRERMEAARHRTSRALFG